MLETPLVFIVLRAILGCNPPIQPIEPQLVLVQGGHSQFRDEDPLSFGKTLALED